LEKSFRRAEIKAVPLENLQRVLPGRFRMQLMSRTHAILILALMAGSCLDSGAQDAPPASREKTPTPPGRASSNTEATPHRFWDWQNDVLFTGVGAARMLDYASTRHFRAQGNHEVLLTDSIVDNKPLFVGIELAGTAASIGVSYLCHRTGHHTAERWVSIVHIGVGVGGSIRNYSLKPPGTTP
jgi:hypothetical protein